MTAEVAILNREAVALAADSAVTISGGEGHKIFTSANKIFQLSKSDPVGVMIYDSAAIADVPWETVIKRYRDDLGTKSFPTLDDYVSDFLSYVQAQHTSFFPAQLQADSFFAAVHAFLHLIRSEVDAGVKDQEADLGRNLTPMELEAQVDEVVQANHSLVMAGPPVRDLPRRYISSLANRYGPLIRPEIDKVLDGLPVSTTSLRKLRQLLLNLFARAPEGLIPPIRSGVVFAGFGTDEMFPRLREMHFEGVAADFVKCYPGVVVDIELLGVRATLVPFAQREMVARFMEGVDPEYQVVVESVIGQIVEEYPDVLLSGLPSIRRKDRDEIRRRAKGASAATLHTVATHLAKVREEAFWAPVSQLINLLPKEEIASMAEALVNLTSFKRRVSWDAETVGGPVDVAVISRGDGFVWIKRKHYFDAALNPGFMMNRYGGRR